MGVNIGLFISQPQEVTSRRFGHTGDLWKKTWTDQDAIWETDSCGSIGPCIRLLDGIQGWMNPFTAMRDDKSTMRTLPKYLGHLFIVESTVW